MKFLKLHRTYAIQQYHQELHINERANTRGNNYKLHNHSFHYDLQKHFSLHALLISRTALLIQLLMLACTVNEFEARLDKCWQHQAVKFDFAADLTGTGHRSEVME